MKQKRMSLADIQGKLSRAEMKKIMAGTGCGGTGCGTTCNCNSKDDCKDSSKPVCVNGCGGPSGGYYGNCDTQ